MIPLQTQEQFEELLRPNKAPSTVKKYEPAVGVAFGATWCGPCRRLDKDAIADATPTIKWYYCDVDENQYTPGYCGVQGIPCFVMILDGVFNPNKSVGASSVQEVVSWAKALSGTK
jgi:thiol-disulfide isomerase/thioredoxin